MKLLLTLLPVLFASCGLMNQAGMSLPGAKDTVVIVQSRIDTLYLGGSTDAGARSEISILKLKLDNLNQSFQLYPTKTEFNNAVTDVTNKITLATSSIPTLSQQVALYNSQVNLVKSYIDTSVARRLTKLEVDNVPQFLVVNGTAEWAPGLTTAERLANKTNLIVFDLTLNKVFTRPTLSSAWVEKTIK